MSDAMTRIEHSRPDLPHRLRAARWNDPAILLPLVAFCLAAWLFLELADDAPEGDYASIDHRILIALRAADDLGRGIGPPWLSAVARDVTALGDVLVLLLVSALAAGFWALRGNRRSAVLIFVATYGGQAVNSGLKGIYERERPTVVPHLIDQASLSFPSGHSMVGAATYLTLGALISRRLTRRREKAYVLGCAALLSFAIGVSRVYLGVHYPTDVLAGWSAGIAWTILCWSVASYLQRRTPTEPRGERDPRRPT